jgi:hypothetical protein
MSRVTRLCFVLFTSLTLFAVCVFGRNKHPKAQPGLPQDEIQVIAHVPSTGGPVTQFVFTQHYRRDYLYAGHESGKLVSLIDVTDLRHPAVLADMSYPAAGGENMIAAVGNSALVATAPEVSAAPATPKTFRIMSFADPLHPTVKQEFAGVTAMARDEKRGLIFLANSEGIWVLQQQFAADPQAEKEWEHMMLDAR